MNLRTTYLGMELRTPLVVSASPLSEDIDSIKRMEHAGASAVVLYSLFEEQLIREQLELHYHLTHGTESYAESPTYFPEQAGFITGPELYLEHIRKAKEAVDIPIIASLNGSTLGGWTKFARSMQEAGADAIELNIYYIPSDKHVSGAEVEQHYVDIVTAVRQTVSIPVAVKLSPFFSNMAYMAHLLEGAGANGLVMFNRFYQPDIDLELLDVKTKILLSTPPEMRLPLRWIAMLYGRYNLDYAATTGIHSAEDVLKMLMVGANVTMMASTLIQNGIEHITTIENDLRLWMEKHEYNSVRQMQGSMSQIRAASPGNFERAQYVRAVSTMPREFRKS